MFRSICIVSREYPPETAFGGIARMYEMLARALSARGIAVHVISLDTTGASRFGLQDGTAVYRVPEVAVPAGAGPDVQQALWAERVAAAYRELDARVGFDVVLAPEYGAESLKIVPGPHTSLVVRLATCQALVDPARYDARFDPAYFLAAQMELSGIARADAVVAPTRLVSERTRPLVEHEAAVLPSVFETGRLRRRCAPRTDVVELVYVGRLEPRKAPEIALHCVAELVRRGAAAHLTLVGRDTPTAPGGGSYRRGVLLPTMAALGLGCDAVRFVEQLDFDGVQEHLSVARAAVLPSRFENFHTAAVEALAIGVPVFCGSETGLTEWVSPEEGLVGASIEDPGRFAEVVADHVLDPAWCARASMRGPERVRTAFSPEAAAEAYIAFFESLAGSRRPPRAPSPGPRLGIVMLAHNAAAYTRRAIESVLFHTSTAFRLVVVDNASGDGTADYLASIEDPRVEVVSSPENLGVPGGRNAGLAILRGDEDYVVFLDNDVEVLAGWWRPFVGALETDPTAGIAGEDGVRVTWSAEGRELVASAAARERCDIVVGFCMFVRAATLARVGRFDERLGLFWHDDDDYALRAARVGEGIVAVRSGLVLHFGHRSSRTVEGIWDGEEPAALSGDNQRRLAAKRRTLLAAGRFLVLADAGEAAADPALLSCWARAFTKEDRAALVLYGPGLEPASYVPRLEQAAAWAGLDLEEGPALVAKLPPFADAELESTLADEVCAFLGQRPPQGVFSHLATLDPGDPDGLRLLAAKAWGAGT